MLQIQAVLGRRLITADNHLESWLRRERNPNPIFKKKKSFFGRGEGEETTNAHQKMGVTVPPHESAVVARAEQRNTTLNKCGGIFVNNEVGHVVRAKLLPGPLCDRTKSRGSLPRSVRST